MKIPLTESELVDAISRHFVAIVSICLLEMICLSTIYWVLGIY